MKAAKLGHPGGYYHLGFKYFDTDPSKSFKFFLLAAEKGHKES